MARQTSGGTVNWYQTDLQGSVRQVINNSAVVQATATYSAFGSVAGGSLSDRFGFTAQEHDALTGMVSLGNGTRELSNGRFMQGDPIWPATGEANPYVYVGNAPTNWTDPSGLYGGNGRAPYSGGSGGISLPSIPDRPGGWGGGGGGGGWSPPPVSPPPVSPPPVSPVSPPVTTVPPTAPPTVPVPPPSPPPATPPAKPTRPPKEPPPVLPDFSEKEAATAQAARLRIWKKVNITIQFQALIAEMMLVKGSPPAAPSATPQSNPAFFQVLAHPDSKIITRRMWIQWFGDSPNSITVFNELAVKEGDGTPLDEITEVKLQSDLQFPRLDQLMSDVDLVLLGALSWDDVTPMPSGLALQPSEVKPTSSMNPRSGTNPFGPKPKAAIIPDWRWSAFDPFQSDWKQLYGWTGSFMPSGQMDPPWAQKMKAHLMAEVGGEIKRLIAIRQQLFPPYDPDESPHDRSEKRSSRLGEIGFFQYIGLRLEVRLLNARVAEAFKSYWEKREWADAFGRTGIVDPTPISAIFEGGAELLQGNYKDAGIALATGIPVFGKFLKAERKIAKGGVYVLRDPVTGTVMKSGRTNDLARRELELARDPTYKGFQFVRVHRTDNYAERRGLEQMLHESHQPPLDKINGIDPNNPRLQEYLDKAREFLRRKKEEK